ncbi:hypothetical protein [Parabacteroides gordonii]|uniref:hypothetical protein n=1 Tax=Parabacteroides gordonii TaxID=574930 RepID=UPI0026F25DA9|nr:hypothetical protein [Parabacteroides gordonii]
MILYKPTGQIFQNRKEAKQALGVTYWHKLEKEKRDIEFIPDNNDLEIKQLATNESINKTTI